MILNKFCYLLVTGASKGIGKQIAIECSKTLKPNSLIVLMARSINGLEETREEILKINKKLTVKIYSIDLGQIDSVGLYDKIDDSLQGYKQEDFELAWIIHNAGTLGDVSKMTKDLIDTKCWSDYYSLNLFSVAALNGEFLKKFSQLADNKKIIVNITSKAAISPFKSFSLYCSVKAAREMYFKVLAEEQENLVILNYSPGPCDTKMQIDVQLTYDDSIKETFKSLRDNKLILSTIQTTEKLLHILKEQKFKSGDHVDYFD